MVHSQIITIRPSNLILGKFQTVCQFLFNWVNLENGFVLGPITINTRRANLFVWTKLISIQLNKPEI